MATPYEHSKSSVNKFGGTIEDFLPIHEWFDASKEFHPDFRHRALRHHIQGIFECQRIFGSTIKLSTGKEIETKKIAEQHIIEDMDYIPSLSDWLNCIYPQNWMTKNEPDKKYNLMVTNSTGGQYPVEYPMNLFVMYKHPTASD